MDLVKAGLSPGDLRKLKGRDICTTDGQKIGSIDEVISPMEQALDTFFIVHADDQERYVPAAAMQDFEEDRVVLEVSQAKLTAENWETPPPGWVPTIDEPGLT
jgi:sporulation protein YlmC with PRC-barrel domain